MLCNLETKKYANKWNLELRIDIHLVVYPIPFLLRYLYRPNQMVISLLKIMVPLSQPFYKSSNKSLFSKVFYNFF